MLATVAAAVRVGEFGTPAGIVTAVIAPGTDGSQFPATNQSELIAPVQVADDGTTTLIVMLMVVPIAHWPVEGVNVYSEAPTTAVLTWAGSQVPTTPLEDVVGKNTPTLPWS